MAGLIKAAQFYENEPRLFALAEALTTKYDVLAMIYDNLLLFRSYIRADCIRYADLADALWNLQPESVLIYFAEINLYGIFTTKSYLNFCRNLSDKVEDGDITAENLSIYQLVFSGKRQKLVFVCTDASYVHKMSDYAKKCFAEIVSTSKQEITVNISCSNEDEISMAYNKLYNYIRDQKDLTCCNFMKQSQLLQRSQHQYREYECSDSIGVKSLDELLTILKTADHLTINGPITINNQCRITTNNNQIFQTDKKQIAKDWIKNNPPTEHVSTSEYYQKYKSRHDDGITIQKFTTEVISAGYKKLHGKINYWVKSS